MEMPRYAKILCVLTLIIVMAAYGHFVRWILENHSYWWVVLLGLATFAWAFWQDVQDKKEAERLAREQAEWDELWGDDWWEEETQEHSWEEYDEDIIDAEYEEVRQPLLLFSESMQGLEDMRRRNL